MPYTAQVLKIMIASPSDVEVERAIVRDVIHDWNCVNSEERGIVLLPVSWESHAAPSMAGRPQEIINREVLTGCDLLVAVFWTRIGSHTGVAISGTVEELNEHVASGRHAMLYFSEVPVGPSELDRDQYDALRSFRDRCKPMALVDSYESHDVFEAKFRRQLAIRINESFPGLKRATTPLDGRPAAAELPALSKDAERVLLAGANDESGRIYFIQYSGGFSLQVSDQVLNDDETPRTQARWQAALNELKRRNLIQAEGPRGESYTVTHDGYELAQSIQATHAKEAQQ